MIKISVCLLLAFMLAVPLFAEQQTWENVPVIDTMCLSKVKEDPDKHQKKCLLQCAGGGLGILDADGNYLKLDDAGSEKVIALIKESDKTDHLRVTITGEHSDGTIKVASAKLM